MVYTVPASSYVKVYMGTCGWMYKRVIVEYQDINARFGDKGIRPSSEQLTLD